MVSRGKEYIDGDHQANLTYFRSSSISKWDTR